MPLTHHLVALWFADIAGYSDRAAEDERGALQLIEILQTLSRDTVRRYEGRVVNSWATRVRRDDLLTLQVDGTEASAVAGLHRCFVQRTKETPSIAHFNIAKDLGVDLIESPDGLQVLEVNHTVEFQGLQSAHANLDLADAIVCHALDAA